MIEKRWQPGDVVILRYALYEPMTRVYQALTSNPTNLHGWPYLVLRDDAEMVALYLPEGTKHWRWYNEEERFGAPMVTQGDSLRLLFPGKGYDVSLYYETGSGPAPWVRYYFPEGQGPFYGWKVDLASPFRRTAMGFDVLDEVLDIVVNPDRSYYWKDEDQMSKLIELGIYTAERAEEIRETGREAIKLIEAGLSPFTDEWRDWRPSPDLVIRNVPDGWHLLPHVEGP